MTYLKNLGISLLWIISIFLIFTFIITFLNYINIIGDNVISIFKILIPVISLFIGGFMIGKRSKNKGWLEGLKLGFIFSILIVIFNFLAFNNSFKIKYLLFYLIIIISSILGSMIGINRKKG